MVGNSSVAAPPAPPTDECAADVGAMVTDLPHTTQKAFEVTNATFDQMRSALSKVAVFDRVLQAVEPHITLDADEDSLLDALLVSASADPDIHRIVGGNREYLQEVLRTAAHMTDKRKNGFPTNRHALPFFQSADAKESSTCLLGEEVGRGGFASVVRGFVDGKPIAVKIAHPRGGASDPTKFHMRFRTEPQALRKLAQTSVVPHIVFESSDDEEVPYFGMEFVDGHTIAEINDLLNYDMHQEIVRPERWVVQLYMGIAEAIAEVHGLDGAADATSDTVTFIQDASKTQTIISDDVQKKEKWSGWRKLFKKKKKQTSKVDTGIASVQAPKRGLVHRDLKPENIKLGPDGKLTILDFGIAHDEDQVTMTNTGDIMGTPRYMAPEMIEDLKHATAAVDVYALGMMLFESLTGSHPFEHFKTTLQIINAQRNTFPNFDVIQNPTLQALLKSMLCKQPSGRPTMKEVALILHREFLSSSQSESEQVKYQDFLSKPAVQRRVAVPAALEATHLYASAGDVREPAESISMRLLDEIPNADEGFINSHAAPGAYEQDSQGRPVKIGALRRTVRSKIVQATAFLSVATAAIALPQLKHAAKQDVDAPPIVARVGANGVLSGKEQHTENVKPLSPFAPKFRLGTTSKGEPVREGIEEMRVGIDGEDVLVSSSDMPGVYGDKGEINAFLQEMPQAVIKRLREHFRSQNTGGPTADRFSSCYIAPDGAMAILVPHIGLVCQDVQGRAQYVWDVQWSTAMKNTTPPPAEIEAFFSEHFPLNFSEGLQRGETIPLSLRERVPDLKDSANQTSADIAKFHWNQIRRAAKIGMTTAKQSAPAAQSPMPDLGEPRAALPDKHGVGSP